MKIVLLLRHAKSDWGNPGLADFDRPLAKRGLSDAPRMGHLLADFDTVPDKILASPAKRAKQTAEIIAKACGYSKSIEWQESFYGGDSQTLVDTLKTLPNTVEKAMLVGHNPTMEETAVTLLHGSDDGFEIIMPTAALLCLDLNITNWAHLETGEAILRWFVIPRLIKVIT